MRDLVRFTRSEHLNDKMVPEVKNYDSPGKQLDCPSLKIPGEGKLSLFIHHKSLSQRVDTWQPTDREDTMPSWTEPTLDQLIIRFNASKSINHAIPMWNKHIFMTPNSVETNTHVSTLQSMIRKQLSKIGQSTEWHLTTQACRCPNPLRHSTLKCTRLTSSGYQGRDSGYQQLPYWTWHSWPELSQ